MIDFLRENAWGKHTKELTKMFNEHFGVEKTAIQIAGVKKHYGFKCGFTGQFEKGLIPHNTMPLNSLKKDHKDGYWYRKYSMTGKTKKERWIACHHETWIKAHGPIPKDCVVIFLDGNKDNYALENLALIKRSTNARLNQMHMRYSNSETTRTAITHAQLTEAISRIENSRHKKAKNKDKE